MRKTLFTLAAIIAVTFVGCSDDDDKNLTDTLNGTTWEYVEKENDATTFLSTVTFSENTFTYSGFEVYNDEGGKEDIKGEGTYFYEPPVLTLVEDGEVDSAYVKGNIFEIQNEDHFVFVKK